MIRLLQARLHRLDDCLESRSIPLQRRRTRTTQFVPSRNFRFLISKVCDGMKDLELLESRWNVGLLIELLLYVVGMGEVRWGSSSNA